MSYTRKYQETISEKISKQLKVSFSSDSNGKISKVDVQIDNKTHSFSGNGTKNIDVEAKIPVSFEIEVDTRSFDTSVEHCNTNVNLLTGAVVATEVAQIASINKNSKKVASTIVNGFFGYIKSEISQQISELTQNIDAQLMHLKELTDACVAKKIQMEGDFNRISGRYIKIFDDLNKELSNRIMELDKPTFVFKKELDNQSIRSVKNDMVNTVLVFGKEGGMLSSKLGVTLAKKRALDTLNQAKIFLLQQKYLNYTVQRSMINENIASTQYSPVCFIESNEEKNQISKQIYLSSYITTMQDNVKKNEMIEEFSKETESWTTITSENNESIRKYFNSEINDAYVGADPHTERVKAMINKIANLGTIQTINN